MKTILVVDDEVGLRLTLSLVLQREGYRVETVSDGQEALERLETTVFDLLFLDLNMPRMSGMDLLVEIHKQYPRLPVLILTAHATLDSAIQGIRLGARDYLLKPMEPDIILVRVAEILSELEQPERKLMIVSQLQVLLSELQQMEGGNATPTSTLAALPPADSARFLQKGPFVLDLHARHATLNNQYLPVTGVNFDYFATLLRHAPQTLSNKTLVKESQGFQVSATEARDLARWRIHELRKIIEADVRQPKFLLTVRGEGYRLAI